MLLPLQYQIDTSHVKKNVQVMALWKLLCSVMISMKQSTNPMYLDPNLVAELNFLVDEWYDFV